MKGYMGTLYFPHNLPVNLKLLLKSLFLITWKSSTCVHMLTNKNPREMWGAIQ